ncbi:MAG: hypothetical protein WBN04_08665 [Paracoccaceae bacterium]
MAFDPFSDAETGLQSPATIIQEIIPSDTTDLEIATRAINVATSGVVRILTIDDTEGDVFVVAGSTFPVRARRVLATGTTATGIRGLS